MVCVCVRVRVRVSVCMCVCVLVRVWARETVLPNIMADFYANGHIIMQMLNIFSIGRLIYRLSKTRGINKEGKKERWREERKKLWIKYV